MNIEALVCPPEYHVMERGERFLVIDPVAHLWFVTDRIGKLAVEALAARHPYPAIKQMVAEAIDAGALDSAHAYLSTFYSSLHRMGFLHEGTYKPRPLPTGL